jgi:hypothetical protein
LLEVEELVAHNLDKSSGDVSFAELGLESIPGHHLAFGLHGANIFPPCTHCSSKEMGGVEHLLVLSNSFILEFVLDGAEPVVGVKRFGGLGEGWRVGVLEVPKLAAGLVIVIATTVVVVGGNLCEVLKGCKVSLALGACGFAFFKHEPQHLLHAWFRGWWQIASSLASRFRSHSGEKWFGEAHNKETYACFK